MLANTLAASTRRPLTIAVVLAFLAAMAFTAVGATMTAAPAQALCSGSSPATGTWHNIDSNTRSVKRVDVDWGCADQALCDESGCVYPAGTTRVFGSCTPTDCDWGTRRNYAEKDGWRSAKYTYSWATKHVWVKPYSYYGKTYLRVWVHTDFTPADGRKDYTTDEWMLK
jgi:hypothetical protein